EVCRTATLQQRRQSWPELGSLDALDAQNSDLARCQFLDQMRDCMMTEANGRKIEHHRTAGKKARRAAVPVVEPGKPFRDRRLRSQRERQERAAAKTHGLVGMSYAGHGGPR